MRGNICPRLRRANAVPNSTSAAKETRVRVEGGVMKEDKEDKEEEKESRGQVATLRC